MFEPLTALPLLAVAATLAGPASDPAPVTDRRSDRRFMALGRCAAAWASEARLRPPGPRRAAPRAARAQWRRATPRAARRGRPACHRGALPARPARQPGRPVGMGSRVGRDAAFAALEEHARLRREEIAATGDVARAHPCRRPRRLEAALRATSPAATRASTTRCGWSTATAACATCCRAASRSATRRRCRTAWSGSTPT